MRLVRHLRPSEGGGGTQELLHHGSTIAVIKSSGAWSGSGYGGYIDLEFDKAQKTPKILTTYLSDDSSSGDERANPTRKRGVETKGRKIPKASNRSKDSSSPRGPSSTSESD